MMEISNVLTTFAWQRIQLAYFFSEHGVAYISIQHSERTDHLSNGYARQQIHESELNRSGALKMQDRKMTDKDIAGGGKCRTGI